MFNCLTSPQKRHQTYLRRTDSKKRRKEASARCEAAQGLVNLSYSETPATSTNCTATSTQKSSSSTPNQWEVQTELRFADITSLHDECQALRKENALLKTKIANLAIDEDSLQNNDEKVKTVTGLCSFHVITGILALISVHLRPSKTLSNFQQLY